MTALPKNLQEIQDFAVDHINKRTPLPENFHHLIEWYEGDGWDELMAASSFEHLALKLFDLASLKFSDGELEADLEDPAPITNKLRVSFARKLIKQAFEEADGFDCPSVHILTISKSDGNSAVLGWTIEIHGQAGPVPEFNGIYINKDDFYASFNCDYLLLDKDSELITDEAILKLWRPPHHAKKSSN